MVLHRIALREGADLAGFRHAVRMLVARQIEPVDVEWCSGETPTLFGTAMSGEAPPIALPRAVADLLSLVVCHRDPERYALLYRLVWRVLHGERTLLEVQSDRLVHRLEMLRKAVRRDLHKMHAFLRFRRAETPDGAERFVAWFEPDHYILDAAGSFFVERFAGLRWSILTPIGSLHWDRQQLVAGPPAAREDAPSDDAFEAGWRGYYESTFNPGRVNPTAMRANMPKKYWRSLPETRAVENLIRTAGVQLQDMVQREAVVAVKRNPDKAVKAMAKQEPKTLAALNRIIAASSPLVPGATQAVLGEGPAGATIAFVGEQPGDEEDRAGRPFVGPAGKLLDRAMAEAGIDRSTVYVTNAVKHFKFEQRGKRRIHGKPTAGEVRHYRWWLMKELELVQPGLVVALGATALLALAGKALAVSRVRGEFQFDDFPGYVTVHPSYLLRLPDEMARHRAYQEFVADLSKIRQRAAARPAELPLAARA